MDIFPFDCKIIYSRIFIWGNNWNIECMLNKQVKKQKNKKTERPERIPAVGIYRSLNQFRALI